MARSIEEIEAQLELVNKEITQLESATPGQYSDDELAKMYSLNPDAAQFFAQKQALQTKNEIAIQPKDRSMTVDQIRQQLRIASEGAIRKMEATSNPNLKELYKKEMEIYVSEAAKEDPSIQFASSEVDKLYKTGGQGPDSSALDWWNTNKPSSETIAKYGINADGSIKNITELKDDTQKLARAAGYISLDNTIEVFIDNKNKDMKKTVSASRESSSFELEQSVKKMQTTQEAKDNTYKNLDTKYPNLRLKDIPNANKLVGFIKQGESGSVGARNNAVKSLSRLGSDEALSETDFGRALGRSLGTSVFAGLLEKANANLPITDSEWNKVKSDIISAINNVRIRRTNALNEFTPSGFKGMLLEEIYPLVLNSNMNDGKPLLKTKPGNKEALLKALNAGKK